MFRVVERSKLSRKFGNETFMDCHLSSVEEEEEEEEDGEEEESKIRGPTSDDGGKSLRVTTKTAKVKWKRKVAVLKVHLPRPSSEIKFTSHPFDFKSLHPFSTCYARPQDTEAETNYMSRKGDNRILRAAVSMRGTKESSSSKIRRRKSCRRSSSHRRSSSASGKTTTAVSVSKERTEASAEAEEVRRASARTVGGVKEEEPPMAEEEEKEVGIIDGGDGLADVESGHGDDERGGKSRNAALTAQGAASPDGRQQSGMYGNKNGNFTRPLAARFGIKSVFSFFFFIASPAWMFAHLANRSSEAVGGHRDAEKGYGRQSRTTVSSSLPPSSSPEPLMYYHAYLPVVGDGAAMAALRRGLLALQKSAKDPDMKFFECRLRAIFAEARPGDKQAIKRLFRSTGLLVHPDRVSTIIPRAKELFMALEDIVEKAIKSGGIDGNGDDEDEEGECKNDDNETPDAAAEEPADASTRDFPDDESSSSGGSGNNSSSSDNNNSILGWILLALLLPPLSTALLRTEQASKLLRRMLRCAGARRAAAAAVAATDDTDGGNGQDALICAKIVQSTRAISRTSLNRIHFEPSAPDSFFDDEPLNASRADAFYAILKGLISLLCGTGATAPSNGGGVRDDKSMASTLRRFIKKIMESSAASDGHKAVSSEEAAAARMEDAKPADDADSLEQRMATALNAFVIGAMMLLMGPWVVFTAHVRFSFRAADALRSCVDFLSTPGRWINALLYDARAEIYLLSASLWELRCVLVPVALMSCGVVWVASREAAARKKLEKAEKLRYAASYSWRSKAAAKDLNKRKRKNEQTVDDRSPRRLRPLPPWKRLLSIWAISNLLLNCVCANMPTEFESQGRQDDQQQSRQSQRQQHEGTGGSSSGGQKSDGSQGGHQEVSSGSTTRPSAASFGPTAAPPPESAINNGSPLRSSGQLGKISGSAIGGGAAESSGAAESASALSAACAAFSRPAAASSASSCRPI